MEEQSALTLKDIDDIEAQVVVEVHFKVQLFEGQVVVWFNF